MTTPRAHEPKYLMRLYVVGPSLKTKVAVSNITRICEEYLKSRYALEVIDICEQASLARAEQIVAVPMLVKRSPLPLQRLVGDMSDVNQVLFGLDLGLPTSSAAAGKSC
jgi:circadian clock protein KaiB